MRLLLPLPEIETYAAHSLAIVLSEDPAAEEETFWPGMEFEIGTATSPEPPLTRPPARPLTLAAPVELFA